MKYASYKTLSQKCRYSYMTLIFFLALLMGVIFLLFFSDRFVFRYKEAYTRIFLWSLLVFTPFFIYRKEKSSEILEHLKQKFPTRWVRKFIMTPLISLMSAGLVFTAPLGWVFALAVWSGGGVYHVSATAVKVSSSKSKTCLDTLYPHSSMQTGQVVDVGISESQFGFLIVSLSKTDWAYPPAHVDNKERAQ
jgi:hypothetical protein